MTLSNQQKKYFRTVGHRLKPVVTIAGKGTSPGVIKELERAINDHELIKIKLLVGDRRMRQSVLVQINEILGSITVQAIGNMALIFRASEQPDPSLTNIDNYWQSQ